ncbi:MAG: toll/interleukin-1 receptor domain-containing protein, partial [Chloroflexi bacterium]
MGEHIFISYNWDDTHRAIYLERGLYQLGYPVWRDKRGINPNQHWAQEIRDAIAKATCLVVCMTPTIIERRQVGRPSYVEIEIKLARELDKPVFLVLYDDADLKAFDGTDLDYITGWTYAPFNREKTFDRLKNWIESFAKTGQPRPPALADVIAPYEAYLTTLRDHVTQLEERLFRFIDLPIAGGRLRNPFARQFAFVEGGATYSTLKDAFAGDKHLLLLGAGGLGKTTALMQFIRDMVDAYRADPIRNYLPIYISAVDWYIADGMEMTLIEWLSRNIPNFDDPTPEMIDRLFRDG